MERSAVVAIATREARASLRNRWFLLYTVVLVLLIVGFSSIALMGGGVAGEPGFGRTSAGLLNLVLLLVPLIGLTIGAQAIAGERQDHSLDYLLAQPVSPFEVYFGKYFGSVVSLILMLTLAFGWAALIMAIRGSQGSLDGFAVLMLLTTLLGLGMLSVGYVISSRMNQVAAALGVALTVWIVFVIVGDLGLMGSALVMNLQPDTLLTLTLINPLDTFKVVSVQALGASLEVLGPAGSYAVDRFGESLITLLLAIEALWVVLPIPVGYQLFKRGTRQ